MFRKRAVQQKPQPHRRCKQRLGGLQDKGYVCGQAWHAVLDEEDKEDYGGEEAINGVCALGS